MRDVAFGLAYRFGRFALDTNGGALRTTDGRELKLRPKSLALLRLLVENAGRLVSRDTITVTLWPDVIVGEDGITQCIADIRRILGRGAGEPVRTIPRRGYIFTMKVEHASYYDRIDPGSAEERPAVVVLPFAELGTAPGDDRLCRIITDEPPRVCRRLFGLSHAAMACSLAWA